MARPTSESVAAEEKMLRDAKRNIRDIRMEYCRDCPKDYAYTMDCTRKCKHGREINQARHTIKRITDEEV